METNGCAWMPAFAGMTGRGAVRVAAAPSFQATIACRLRSISTDGLIVAAPVVGAPGEAVTVMLGPFGTLLRLDIGKTIGRNAQDGFVANVVFLKLF